jgi:hypothetical protein
VNRAEAKRERGRERTEKWSGSGIAVEAISRAIPEGLHFFLELLPAKMELLESPIG